MSHKVNQTINVDLDQKIDELVADYGAGLADSSRAFQANRQQKGLDLEKASALCEQVADTLDVSRDQLAAVAGSLLAAATPQLASKLRHYDLASLDRQLRERAAEADGRLAAARAANDQANQERRQLTGKLAELKRDFEAGLGRRIDLESTIQRLSDPTLLPDVLRVMRSQPSGLGCAPVRRKEAEGPQQAPGAAQQAPEAAQQQEPEEPRQPPEEPRQPAAAPQQEGADQQQAPEACLARCPELDSSEVVRAEVADTMAAIMAATDRLSLSHQ